MCQSVNFHRRRCPGSRRYQVCKLFTLKGEMIRISINKRLKSFAVAVKIRYGKQHGLIFAHSSLENWVLSVVKTNMQIHAEGHGTIYRSPPNAYDKQNKLGTSYWNLSSNGILLSIKASKVPKNQLAVTYPKLTMETPKQCVNSVKVNNKNVKTK